MTTTVSEYEALAKAYEENKEKDFILPSGAEFRIRRLEVQEFGIMLDSKGVNLEDEVLRQYNENKNAGLPDAEMDLSEDIKKKVVHNISNLQDTGLQSRIVVACVVSPPLHLIDGAACIGKVKLIGEDLLKLYIEIIKMSSSSFITKKKST